MCPARGQIEPMAEEGERLPRRLSVLETWGFGFTVLLFWLVVAPEVHELIGPGAIWVWLPATAAGIVVNLQIRRLALARLDAAGGSPVYVAGLWRDRPLLARWTGLAYIHSWAIVPAALSWFLAEFAVSNLSILGLALPAWPIQLTFLAAIYLTAFSGVRVLSVVHLCFVLPSLGLLVVFAFQGVGHAVTTDVPTATFVLPAWSAWLAAYFLVVYTTYGVETAAAFTADSRNPRATINCLLAAAAMLPVIMIGGSYFLAAADPTPASGLTTGAVLESAGMPLWGAFTPIGVTFMVASSMVLACATAVAVAPRVIWQLSRDGLLAPILGTLTPEGVPRSAVTFALLLAVAHVWMGAEQMLLLGGASWIGFWCLTHLGLWRRRGEPSVLWPHLALALAILEGMALVIGGLMLGGGLVLLGLSIPLLLAFGDAVLRRSRLPPAMTQLPWRQSGTDSQAREITLMTGLIVGTVSVGWMTGHLVGSELSAEAMRASIVLLLIAAFVGIAWVSRTSLRRLDRLERAQGALEDIITSAADAMLVVDAKGRIQLANPAAERLLNRSENALMNIPLPEFVPGLTGAPAQWSGFQEFELGGGSEVRTVELAAHRSATAVPAEFTVTMRDLTARKAAEDALRTSEQRLEAAVEASRSVVWELDVVGGTIARSGVGGGLLGLRAKQIPVLVADWERVVHRDDLQAVRDRLEDHVRGTAPVYESEHRLRDAKGEWIWVLERGRGVAWDENGRATRIIGTTTDISDRKRLEQQFNQAQKMEAVGHLAGGVAHDFNNVLTAILTTAELLLEDSKRLQADQLADVQEIRDAALRAAEITRQLLAFGRRQQLRPRTVDVNDAVHGVERLLRRLIGEHIVLETECHPEPALIRTDPGQLEQAIINLALNARDAMPDGGRLVITTLPLTLTPARVADQPGVPPGPAWAVRVSDSGTGMDAATRERLFEPFFTTKGLGQGAGLGMAMVYGFVRQSGGMVHVDSAPGTGTRIDLIFPSVLIAEDTPIPTETETTGVDGQETILLAEDEGAVRGLVERILRNHGYTVLSAGNGREALELAARNDDGFALVISDLVMPEMGGRELVERLRERIPDLRFLFLSGYPSDPASDQGSGGAPAFLQKPFSPMALLREVRRALDA